MKKNYFIISALLAICFLFSAESMQAQAPGVSYVTPQIYTFGTVIESLVPTLSGGTVESYSISPELPSGLSFDTSTGIISGTPLFTAAAADYTVTAINSVDGNGTFVVNIAVNKATQTIVFNALSDKNYGEASFQASATGGASSNAVTFTSSNTFVASCSGSTINLVGAGVCTIYANQEGNSFYTPAVQAMQTLTVAQIPLTITGVTAADKVYDESNVATLTGGILVGVINSEDVTIVAGTGAFADSSVGTDKAVTASGYSLGGTAAGNYNLSTQPTGITASIKALSFAVTFNTSADGTLSVMNGSTPVTSGDLVLAGTVLTITATPGNNGYELVSLKANNISISSGGTFTITSATDILAVFDLGTITDNQTSAGLKIYPTVTTDLIQLSFAEALNVEVVNLTGQVLQNKNVDNSSKLELSLQGYPQGMYFVKVSMKNGDKIVKSVILRN